MGKKSKSTQAQEPTKVIQPYERDWTEPQICPLLAGISQDDAFQKMFFLQHNNHTFKMKRVTISPAGKLLAGAEWPMKMRVISRLFDVIHPLADNIKTLLGPSSTRKKLKVDNPEGYRLWTIKHQLCPDWLNDRSSNPQPIPTILLNSIATRPASSHIPPSPASPLSISSAPSPSPLATPSINGKSHPNPEPVLLSSKPRPSSALSSSSRTSSHQHLTSYFTNSEKERYRQVPPHLPSVKPKLAETLHEFIGSLDMGDIPIESPPDMSVKDLKRTLEGELLPTPAAYPAPTSVLPGKGRTEDLPVRGSEAEGEAGYKQGEELVTAIMLLMIQELRDKKSDCMRGIEIVYPMPLNLSEYTILYLVRKMGGTIINMRDNVKRKETEGHDENMKFKDTYILWNDGCGGDVYDGYRDELPKPITLVGVVQLMVGNRKREREGKKQLMDLITF